jgi:tetratricopeptide (TPR) repeat protein
VGLATAKSNSLEQALSTKLTLSDTMLLGHFNKLVTICWDLLRVDGLPTVGQILSTFLPEVTELAQQSPTCQKEAAGLAAQGYILAGLVATLQLNHAASETYCKRAVLLSRVSEDRTLEAAALKHLAVKYFDLKHPRQTLQTYQEALQFVDQVSPLMQSRTYLGLAAAYAQMRKEQEALRYLGMAQETFPEWPEIDVSFAYADCGPSSLNHYGGLIYMELDQPQKAWETFAEVEQLKQRIIIPERTVIEIVNCQADAAVAQRNLDLASAHIQAGMAGALKLKSERRFADTFAVYKNMRLVWPHEPQVKALGELFQQ